MSFYNRTYLLFFTVAVFMLIGNVVVILRNPFLHPALLNCLLEVAMRFYGMFGLKLIKLGSCLYAQIRFFRS